MSARVQWFASRVHQMTEVIPVRAFKLAASQTAAVGAKMIRSGYSGSLARDISRPRFLGRMLALVGSGLVYAASENWGGTISAKGGGRLLIRAKRTARSAHGGEIVASATSVQHKGKHYLEAMRAAYPPFFMGHLRRMMPK